ncbi:MAG: hypothetical protein JW941_11110 [Candidatus Coatesbacteria bacterium]|nr:hypothetical protein [Candidatus Coatesbacteria bacterium]
MPHSCDRCGVALGSENSSYHVEIRIFAGVEHEHSLGSLEENEAEIDELIDSLDGLGSDVIEHDVYQDISLVLCRRCKEIFAANPLNLPFGASDGDIPDAI